MRWKVSALRYTRPPTRSSSVEEVSTGVRCATPFRRVAARSTSPRSMARSGGSAGALAGILHQPADGDRGEMLFAQPLEQLAHQGLQSLGTPDAELHHLARPQRPE